MYYLQIHLKRLTLRFSFFLSSFLSPRLDNRKILDSAFCAMLSNPPGFPLWEVSSLVFFAIPMAVMVILYGRMGLQIRFRSKHTSVLGKLVQECIRYISMYVWVFICWLMNCMPILNLNVVIKSVEEI